ncbi:hypothetical protein HF521_007183 [Silurus meridionalis]|uniref:Ig-like domain-containing protein n=1 Tax=Silurus meridionalis TaxID=175797 RepID=A0A8T0ATR8_SILME|nr:hypothetical protein HF521_007183 [Silurus meridionalis]
MNSQTKMRPYIMLCLIFQNFKVSLSRQVPCKVELEQGVQYRRITWYKVSFRSDMLVGLVMKDIRSNKTQLYKFVNHSYQIGDDLSLLHVPEHSPEECEIYRCSVWPPVGHRILQTDEISQCMSVFGPAFWACSTCLERSESRNETAIIKRNVNTVTFYNKSSPASLGVQGALVLQNVKPSDSGLYQCFLAANVGHKDMQSNVLLKVSECPTVSPFWTTTGKLCIPNVVEVPLLWSLLGFSFFSLAKILFCTITVIICKKQRGSEARSRSKSGRRRSDSYKHRNIKHI